MRKKILLFALAVFLQSVPPVYADEEATPEFAMEVIMVTDTKIEAEGETTKVTSLNVRDKIDAGQYNSITDLLQDVPGIIVTTSPQAGTTITMRGMSNDRLLVAINGNVIENQGPIFRGRALEWDSLPLSNVKKIEITRGASSAQYGGTWGGVINIITNDTPGELKTTLKTSAGSYGDFKISIANQGTTNDGKFSWSVSADKKQNDGFYRNNDKDSHDANLNMTYNFTEKRKLSFSFTDSYRKEGTVVGNNQNATEANAPWDPDYPTVPAAPSGSMAFINQYIDGSFREFKTRNYSLNYYHDDWKLGLYKNTQDRTDNLRFRTVDQNWDPLNITTSISTIATTNKGYNWQQTKQLSNHRLIYGLDYRNLLLNSSSTALETKMSGYFLQDNWLVSDKVLLGLGLRYDQYKASDNNRGRTYSDKSQLSPKFNVTYKIASQESVFGAVSRVFRAAPPSEYTKWASNYSPANVGSSNYMKYVNDNYGGNTSLFSLTDWQNLMGVLDTESGISYELGWQKQFNTKFGTKIVGFINDIDNYVTSYMGGSINSSPPPYNIDNAKIKGIELSADYQFNKNLGAIFNYTTQSGTKNGDRFDPAGTKLESIPKGTINLGLRYNNHKGFRAALDGQNIKPASNTKTDSYTLFNLGMAYTVKKNQTIALAVNNLFNADYEQTAGFPMPGRNYSMSYQIEF